MKLNQDALRVLKPSWYIHQMKGWTKRSYQLLALGMFVIILTTVTSEINVISITTMFAGVLGYTTTLAITNAKPVNGMFGLISAILYIIVAISAKNYADVVLQAAYIILLDIPVLLLPKWSENVQEHIRGLSDSKPVRDWGLTALFFVIVFGLLYLMDTNLFISPRPILDAFAGAVGITGSILATLRFRDQYYFWIFQGVMSVILWGTTAFQGDANFTLLFTYALYLLNDALAIFDKNIPWFHKNVDKK
ncbi:nicotinamide riboside transporter PnuC [Holzapfeliella floricola]|uniref:Nicotinamide mononucleotide transporter n=1 Tax=Holzapfeliella floricola DSM 23037 = JCM 16512 TaxID=1423744 RepID=A0A0R2DU94_9LACO|nr:nicotinamide riboside transporter PnuC [Holzapfeliella floricola]KRN04026.1 nicotinamide mononucleotide transporter [Holzapfeliella floricola DSM 23037 = JCM 16512]